MEGRALDRTGPYTLEDGLRFHMHRYGITPASNDAARVVSLLESPGDLDHDPHFGDRKDEVLQYLASRAPDLEQFLHQMRIEHMGPTIPEPPDTSPPCANDWATPSAPDSSYTPEPPPTASTTASPPPPSAHWSERPQPSSGPWPGAPAGVEHGVAVFTFRAPAPPAPAAVLKAWKDNGAIARPSARV